MGWELHCWVAWVGTGFWWVLKFLLISIWGIQIFHPKSNLRCNFQNETNMKEIYDYNSCFTNLMFENRVKLCIQLPIWSPVYATFFLGGGVTQIFVRLGGEDFGWELKFHEISLGDQPQIPL